MDVTQPPSPKNLEILSKVPNKMPELLKFHKLQDNFFPLMLSIHLQDLQSTWQIILYFQKYNVKQWVGALKYLGRKEIWCLELFL